MATVVYVVQILVCSYMTEKELSTVWHNMGSRPIRCSVPFLQFVDQRAQGAVVVTPSHPRADVRTRSELEQRMSIRWCVFFQCVDQCAQGAVVVTPSCRCLHTIQACERFG